MKIRFGSHWIAVCVGLLLAALTALPAVAQVCQRTVLSAEVLAKWSNPKPDPNDVLLPIPGGFNIAFVPVPLGGEGLYEGPIYRMGSEQSQSFAFETPLNVRVGSAIVGPDQNSVLLMGKYELSKGQYVMIMGGGDIARGIQALSEHWQDRNRSSDILAPYLKEGGPCFKVVTPQIVELLAEPITFLSYGDYTAMIDALNGYCIARSSCQSILTGLGRNPDYPGFVRLPTEHEWEFVARGGLAFMEGDIGRAALQTDIPFIEAGKTLSTFAHVDNEPARLEAIGTRAKWFGFYDMLGNAEELMQNPFTAENGFGAVGGYVARGGHYRLAAGDVRVSKRVELSLFLRNESTGQFSIQYFPFTGVRLVVGLPVVGSLTRTGDAFDADAYVPLDEAGDIAGNSVAEARALGALTASKTVEANDELEPDDLLDFYTFELKEYADVAFSISHEAGLKLTVTDSAGKVYIDPELTAQGAKTSEVKLDRLLPQTYIVLIEPLAKPTAKVGYKMVIARTLIADTGIERPTTADLTTATGISTSAQGWAGYVGSGDRSDFYPVVARATGVDGIQIRVTNVTAPVTVSLLDERQQVIAQAASTGSSSTVELVAPFAFNQRGFVQILSDATSSTLYQAEMVAAPLYDPVFVLKTGGSPRSAASGKTYTGYLTPSLQTLYLPIRTANARTVRAELSGLSANIDLALLDAYGTVVTTNNVRTGTNPEFIETTLAAGTYYFQVKLAGRDTASKFSLYMRWQEPTAGGGGVIADPAALKAQAVSLPVPTITETFKTVTNKGSAQYFVFPVSGNASMVTVDLSGFTAAEDLDVYLESSLGNVLAKSTNSGSTEETVQYLLQPGRYFIRVQPSGTASGGTYYLSVVGVGAMVEPDMSFFGTMVEVNDDYKVYRSDDKCYMTTVASSTTPNLGWLREKPVFHIGVQAGSDSIWIQLLEANQAGGKDIIQSGSISSYVQVSGSRVSTPAMFKPDDTRLQPLTAQNCDVGFCVDTDAMSTYRRGNELIIEGITAQTSEPFKITYSLDGYTRSANRINEICKANSYWITGR